MRWADASRRADPPGSAQKLVLAADAGAFPAAPYHWACPPSQGDGTDERLLLQRADQALYYAKRHGCNQAVTYGDVAAELKTASLSATGEKCR